jgi:hypothetical protein
MCARRIKEIKDAENEFGADALRRSPQQTGHDFRIVQRKEAAEASIHSKNKFRIIVHIYFPPLPATSTSQACIPYIQRSIHER